MDTGKLAGLLNAPEGGVFSVTNIQLLSWGNDLTFDCLYEPEGLPALPFKLVLNDCRELQWRVYAHLKHPEDKTLPVAMLVNLRLGTDMHRKPLHMLTDFFGLTVSYGTLTVVS